MLQWMTRWTVPLRAATPAGVALALSAVLALAAVVTASPVLAIEPVAIDPPPSSVQPEAPEIFQITFDEPLLLESGANSIVILNEAGQRVDDGRSEIAAYSARTLQVRLDPDVSHEGEFTIGWSVRSAESGAVSRGSYTSTVIAGVVEQPDEEAGEAVVAAARSRESIVLWTVGILAGVALFAAVLYLLRRVSGIATSSLESGEDV